MQAYRVKTLRPFEEVERLTAARKEILTVDFEKIQRWTTSQ